jgi:DNA-binding PadR family transcriptional regulator
MRFVLLALLARGPVHGYELKRTYDRLFSAVWGPMNIGQIYVTMGRLERDALVEMTPDEGRKCYSLTELGTKELSAWITTPVDSVQKSDIVLRLVAAAFHSPDELTAVLSQHRAHCTQSLRELDSELHDAPIGSFAELLVRHAVTHLDAELRWLDIADDRLRSHPILLEETP